PRSAGWTAAFSQPLNSCKDGRWNGASRIRARAFLLCPSAPVDSPLPKHGAFCILLPEPALVLWVRQIMRPRKFYLCLLTATLTASPLWNGLTEEPHSRFPHRSWDVHDGLPDNRIKDINQTSDGYLWLGTRDGLARFDGKRFTVFNQANTPLFIGDDFWSLAEDTRGGLLACSSRGLYRFIGGRFMRFGLGSGLATDWVNSALDNGPTGLWVATEQGLSRYQGGVWTTFSAADGLHSLHTIALHQASKGKLWIGGDGGVQILDPQTLKFLTHLPPHTYSTNLVEAIDSDSKGDVWVL